MKPIIFIALLLFTITAGAVPPPSGAYYEPPHVLESGKTYFPPNLFKGQKDNVTIILEAIINTEGKATLIKVHKSPKKRFNKYAISIMRNSIYQPATKNGEPIAVKIRVPLTLDKNQKNPPNKKESKESNDVIEGNNTE